MADSSQRVALVTGGNKGLGLETCRRLGEAGLTVLLGARNAEAGETAAAALKEKGHDVRFLAVDLGAPETFAAVASRIDGEFGRLDVLVNNAGIYDKQDAAPGVADLAAVRRTFETNFFQTLALTQALLPLVRKSPAGRIVNVSSGLGSLALNADPDIDTSGYAPVGYNASKAALNMMTVMLARELADTPVKVNATNPGYTATDLNDNQGTQTVAEGTDATVRLALLDADGPTGGFFDRDGVVAW